MPSRREQRRKPPKPPPPFFTNRSLGAETVPNGLRADGWQLEAMFEVYGEELSQGMDDPPWITDATRKGQVILTKDYKSLRYREPFQTIRAEGARVFALANQELLGAVQLQWFLTNKLRILRAAKKAGPYIYKVYVDRIERVWP